MPGPGGPHGRGPHPHMGGGMWHRPPMGGWMGHRPPPRRRGCCGCLFPVIVVVGLLITALLMFLF